MIESETVEVGFDAVLLVLKSGVDVVSAVPAVVFCISAVVVITTEEALAAFVTAAVSDSVVSETLSSSSSFSLYSLRLFNNHRLCRPQTQIINRNYL